MHKVQIKAEWNISNIQSTFEYIFENSTIKVSFLKLNWVMLLHKNTEANITEWQAANHILSFYFRNIALII
jgi:hypothetical protein